MLAVAIAGLLLFLLFDARRSGSSESGDSASRDRPRVSMTSAMESEDDERARLDFYGRLAGTVVDSNDEAIAKAQVCVGPDSQATMSELSWRPHCVIADDAGRFEIDAVTPGRQRLIASARGFIPPPILRGRAGLLTTVVAGQVRDGLVLRLQRGGSEVRGTVYDITGGTVAGARVFSEAALTLTDDEGRFSLWLDARSFVVIQVRAEGYAHATISEHRPAGRELEVLLHPEVVMIGRVITAATGEPVADVAVLASAPWGLALGGTTDGQARVRTDADGRFRFSGLRSGRYKPEVRSGRYRGVARASVLLTLGVEPAEVVILVHPARQLSGRVIEAGDGEACEFGSVTIHDFSGAIVEHAIADSSGAIAVGGLLPGPYTLDVKCNQTTPSSHVTVDLAEQDLLDAVWEVETPSGRAIRGRVLDSSGRGVALAYVTGELREPEDSGTKAMARAVSKADGTFEILDLPPGTYNFYRVEAEGMAEPSESTTVTLARDRDTNGVEIVLPDAGALRIRVRDASGNPVPDTEIMVGKGKGGSIHKSTPSSEWLIDPCTPGSYHVKVFRAGVGGRAGPDDPSRAEQGEPVEVVAGETAELTLIATARNEVIAGLVRTTDGDPVADAAVWALSSETFIDWGGRETHPEVARTATDIDGRFTLDNLELGTYSIHARSHAGIEHSREGVASGSKSVTVELPREASLAGRVEVHDGDPPSRFTISIKHSEDLRGRSEEFLFTQGEWRVVGLAPGELTIEVSAAEGTASTSATILEGEQHDGVVLELGARGSLRGRVVDAETGEPVAGYYAIATSTTRGAQASALDPEGKRYTNADGVFELEQVPSGDVTVRLWSSREASSSYRDIDLQLKVEPGKTTDAGTIEAVRKQADLPADE